jgi:hypothetical protein
MRPARPNAGQNRMPDDELPIWRVSEYIRATGCTPSRQGISREAATIAKEFLKRVQRLHPSDFISRQ